MDIRAKVQELLALYRTPAPQPTRPEDDITVSPATRRIAFAYERFRNTLEPDEEDILRRNAIWRILTRRLDDDRAALPTATALLQELLRGSYLKTITRPQAERVAQEIERTRSLKGRLSPELYAWFLRLIAVSIDRELFPRQQDEALVHLMYHDTYQRTVWLDELVAEADRPQQLYVGCHRALFAADDYEISYHYFLNAFPWWKEAAWAGAEQTEVATRLPGFARDVERILQHPNRQRILYLLRSAAVPYRVLKDVCVEATDPFRSAEELASVVREAVSRRSSRIVARMNKRATHSVFFLLFTKTFLALVLELPYEAFLLGDIHWLALGINIAFHPLLLFLVSTWTRLPGSSNTDRIVEQVQVITTGTGELPTIVMNSPRLYGPVTWSLFGLFYTALFIAVFWALFVILNTLHFSLLGMMLFIVFLGLVVFLSARIRRSADELRVVPRRDTAAGILLSFFGLPILEFGSWLTRHINQINILLFVMDRILEAPFKLLIDVIEEWFGFVRDRREEIV